MIIVAGWLRVEPGSRERYLSECLAAMELAQTTPGCRDFILSADPIRPDRIRVFERWESDDDLLRFRGSDPGGEQAAQVLDASVHKYRIAAIEPP
jgi:quinol monooxygenase YgiN